MKFFKYIVPVILIAAACNSSTVPPAEMQTEQKPVQKRFTSFELSYTDGWAGYTSFYADSSGLFYFPNGTTQRYYYSTLPDSMLQILDSAVDSMINDKALISVKNRTCIDCGILSVVAIKSGDTLNYMKDGDIAPVFYRLMKKLKPYLVIDPSRKNTKIFEKALTTMKDIAAPPPPPPIIPLIPEDDDQSPPPVQDEKYKNKQGYNTERAD